MIPFNKPPLKVDGGVYIARDERRIQAFIVRAIEQEVRTRIERRIPRVVVLVSLKAETEHHGLVAAYHDIGRAEQLICCTPAEFKRWYRKRRQFLWWKERI